jgi:hypothetical protein
MGRFAVGACQDCPADVGEFGSVQVLEVVPVQSERGSVGPASSRTTDHDAGPSLAKGSNDFRHACQRQDKTS